MGDGAAAARASHTLEPFREGLRGLGYVEGRNLVIDARWTDGKPERLAEITAGFVRANVDVIVTHGVPAATAAKVGTTRIPIVIATAADLVGSGIVASLARPGANVTGTSDQVTEISAKEVELLKEVLPRASRRSSSSTTR
jgi:putative ABC transport system substrate-binding protein